MPSAQPGSAETNPFAQAFAGFFDGAWYLKRYPDIAAAGLDPLDHFVHHGIAEGRDPNPWFDAAWYLESYADVAASGINPLVHYLQVGASERRNPHPRFDAAWYVQEHPEAAGNPMLYHVRVGQHAGWATERTLDIRDYLPSADRAAAFPNRVVVDVVVPVYKGLDQTRRCLESVLADDSRPDGRIIVVDDRSPEPALSAWLDEMAQAGRILLVRNRRNLGFVASVNRGMAAAAPHDVVLLNSDTEVPRGWLRRLAAQAYAGPKIASVSPFSNNATICSYPRDAGGPIPFGLTLEAVDDACRLTNPGRSVAVPTTVGFCMYIRRAALDEVGAFDAVAFGRGYGEENDFCIRAAQRGWQNRLACDVFVYHEGSVSFGPDAGALAAKGFALIRARYPDYAEIVARHVTRDEVGSSRFAVTFALFARSALPKVLMVVHDLGGGVRRHVDKLVDELSGRAECLLLSATPRGASLSVPAIPGHATLVLPADRLDDLVTVLRHAGVGRVHVHHLMGVAMDVRALIHRLGVPFDVTVHDYYALCPQVNLLPWPDQPYCGEPAPAVCNACIGGRSSHGAREILSWRREQVWQFLEADRVLCPSEDARQRLIRHGIGDRAMTVPHEAVDGGAWRLSPPPLRGNRLRVAVLGVLANHKGAHTVAAVAEAANPADLRVHLIGHTEDDFPSDALSLLTITGKYEEADLPALLAEVKPHVVWFPAPWPETYSYTLSAALAAGLPVVASRIGAFPERLEGRPLTWLAEPTSSSAEWLALFEEVREALRSKRVIPAGRQPMVPAFYRTAYLPAPAVRDARGGPVPHRRGGGGRVKPGHDERGAAGATIDLRRSGRTAVVLVPERLDNDALSPCAYIRLLQPLDHPAIGGDLDIVIADAAEALSYRADLIVTQRYAVPDVAAADALGAHAAATGAGLVYDLDDDLLNIPLTHADAAELRPKARTVQLMLRHATQVWVSTPALAQSIASVRDDAVVLPNALDERLWLLPPRPPRPPGSPLRILCMGTQTHGGDFALIQPGLERLKDVFGDRVTIDMLGVTGRGDLPSWINRLSMTPNGHASYPGFVNWITQQPAWDIGLAPLADTAFNRGKSSIKTLDYAALGMPVLASDVAAYRGSLADGAGGMLLPNEPHAWYAALSWLRRDPAALARLAEGARAAFVAAGTLTTQAEARRAALAAVRPAAPVVRRRNGGGASRAARVASAL
jgi:GT2 family glycosyltransferase/glycosyltransferase involved in cell wall biosynthesis